MNPKSEFVKAIMSVLRLEPNIYTTGAIETIIERLETSDYQLFIAYLGERNSEFEKPIENIAKGVDEFYKIKLKPYEEEASKIATKLYIGLSEAQKLVSAQSEQYTETEEAMKIVEGKMEEFTVISDIARTNKIYDFFAELKTEKQHEIWEKIESRESQFFKSLLNAETKERFISEKEEDILFAIGGFDKLRDTRRNYAPKYILEEIEKYLLKDIYKPSIIEKIYMTEKKDENLMAIGVRNKLSGLLKTPEDSFRD